RCIVVHATSRVTIADNVAYETRGHCFVLEEGSEARNTFIRNLGMSTRAVQRLIPPASLAKFDRQTDNQPSTFWLATPFNSFVGNVAAGSEDSGFWLELNKHMRGLSRNLPFWKNLSPMTLALVFTANVLHSNALFGLRTYPHGARPAFPSQGKGRKALQVRISHSLIYSNPIGVFLQSITIGHSTFLNNRIAIDLNRNFGILILACTFIGRTACSKSSGTGGSTPYDAAPKQRMPSTPPQLLPSTHAPSPLMPSTHATPQLMPSTLATPQLPAGAASSRLHVEPATNEDEMEGYTTSNWQSPGLMLTAPQYSMEDDYSEDGYSETAEAATTGVMGTGGKWGWRRRRRAGGESNGSAYDEDGGDDVGLGDSTAKRGLEVGGKGREGMFKSPIGVMLSQVKLSGMLEEANRFSGFGECGPTLKSSALVLAVNKAGGFWNPAMSVKVRGKEGVSAAVCVSNRELISD
ncbi:unnamed protein product, partial [Closterium sp. Naga37s-1]